MTEDFCLLSRTKGYANPLLVCYSDLMQGEGLIPAQVLRSHQGHPPFRGKYSCLSHWFDNNLFVSIQSSKAIIQAGVNPSIHLSSHSNSQSASYPSRHPSTRPSSHLFIDESVSMLSEVFIHPSIHSSIQESVSMIVVRCTHPSIHPSITPHIHPSIYTSIHPSSYSGHPLTVSDPP